MKTLMIITWLNFTRVDFNGLLQQPDWWNKIACHKVLVILEKNKYQLGILP